MAILKSFITPAAFKPSDVLRVGRDMPKGSIGWLADCSDNPMDIRPAVETILRAIDEKRATLPEGQTLVVPVGESHARPTHSSIFTLLAKEMKERGDNFVVSLEQDHDKWKTRLEKTIGIHPKHIPDRSVHEVDPYGRDSLLTLLTYINVTNAPFSHDNLLEFLYQNDIKTIFSDAAATGGRILRLDLRDSLTRHATLKYLHESSLLDKMRFAFKTPFLSYTSPGAMAIRNDIMKTLTLEYARKNQAPIALLHCGRGHIFGNAQEKDPYAVSLDALFRQEAAVLPVFITREYSWHGGLNTLEKRAYPFLRDSVVIDGIEDTMFYCDEGGGIGTSKDPLTGQAEIDFLRKIREETEGALPLLVGPQGP